VSATRNPAAATPAALTQENDHEETEATDNDFVCDRYAGDCHPNGGLRRRRRTARDEELSSKATAATATRRDDALFGFAPYPLSTRAKQFSRSQRKARFVSA